MKGFVVASMLMGVSALSLEESKNRPVSKVINLLKDMQKQLAKEAEDDQEVYDKMACWCTTNDKSKTAAIAENEQRIQDLIASIEHGTGKSAQLTTEIANLDKEIAENQAALDKATALRQKQLAEFNAEEKDLLQSIQGLKNAVTVLSKHHGGSLLQAEAATALPDIAFMLRNNMAKYDLAATITPNDREVLTKFLQAPAYNSQSGEIFGILKNMKDTFEANLKTAQEDEKNAQANFEGLKEAKSAEIEAATEQVDKKTNELAATDEKLANDKQDVEDTRKTLAADEEFLGNLKEKCKQTDQEYEARQKTRAEEIAAVGKALEFLSSDDAHDLFTKTFNFVQVSAAASSRKARAVAVLQKAAAKLGKTQLAALALTVKEGWFTAVSAKIDAMVGDLLKQKKDEAKHRDFCIKALNENEQQTTHNTRNKEDLLAKIDQLKAEITTLTTAVEELKAQISDAEVQLKRAGEDREKQNLEFQATVNDQKATIQLLTQAMEVLKGFYEKKALLQQPAGPPPPAGFKSYENNAGGGGVIGMITQIVEDSKAMLAEAVHDETDAQAAYESFVKETNKEINTKNADIVNKNEQRATAEGNKTDAENDLDSTTITLEQLANEKVDLHEQCDFFTKNFDVRQTALSEEVEALRQAKSILAGSK